MTGTFTLVWDERLTKYDFGPGHPLAPVRVELTIALARELGVLDRPEVTVLAPVSAQVTELEPRIPTTTGADPPPASQPIMFMNPVAVPRASGRTTSNTEAKMLAS